MFSLRMHGAALDNRARLYSLRIKIHLSPSPCPPPIGGEGQGEGVFSPVTSISALSRVWRRGLGYGGHRVRGHAQALAILVSSDVAGDESEAWCERLGPSTCARARKLSDGLGLAA